MAWAGLIAGFATGLATLVGASIVTFGSWSGPKRRDLMLGFASGVMLSASYLSLIVPAAKVARENGSSPMLSALIVAASVLLGAVSLEVLRRSDRLSGVALGNSFPPDDAGQRVWLLVIAMTSHNLPEGAAVGVAFAAPDPSVGLGTAIGIGVQNIPEGLAVSAALLTLGWSRKRAILASGATGIMEPVGAAIAVTLVALVSSLLPIAMGWAAGAMLYIVAAELIPAIHRDGDGARATMALMAGLALMLVLDLALG